ncbi:MAG: carbamoyltransferase [Opitutaceae bacterium]
MPTTSRTILGLSGYYHDSAAALIADGRIVAAAQEERFTRKKHDPGFPRHAVAYCLREAGLTIGEIDYVAFYEKPLRKFDRLLETYLAFAPVGFRSFRAAMPEWLKTKLHLPREIRKALGASGKRGLLFCGHHESHAASAFFPSPFGEAAILTLDGVGEWDTATIGIGRGNDIELLQTLPFPASPGLLYSAFTYQCGFRVNSGEYKLMGLAPYGEPRYEKTIRDHLIDLREDGSFALDLQYFNYCQGLTMTNRRFDRLFDGPPRQPESPITQREADLAASVQVVIEDVVLRMARTARNLTGQRNLCLAGGVALNCVANGKLLRSGRFDDIWIQPAAGDAGGALGAALLIHFRVLRNERTQPAGDTMRGSLLGPSFNGAEIQSAIDNLGARGTRMDESKVLEQTVDALEAGQVVGWFQGRMEFGPRALGARSILGDPRNPQMQRKMNLQIKFRESFRPFAPAVLADKAAAWFDLDPPSPYMLLVAGVSARHRVIHAGAPPAEGGFLERLATRRSTIPAVTHVDGSARIQTVDGQANPRFQQLLTRFEARTGCPILVNTSFNVRGEPPVCTPADAIRCFLATGMDLLVIGDHILRKTDQPENLVQDHVSHKEAFALD